MREVKISIIVTHYNRITLCLRCLRSIASQTVPPYEVIIVDDCSDVDLTPLVREADKHGWRVLRKDSNRFVADSRHQGVLAAAGTHIVFIDDDDYFYPTALATFQYLIENDWDTPWSCRLTVVREDGTSWVQPSFGISSKTNFHEFLSPLFSIHATVAPRSLIVKHDFDTTLRYYVDIDLWISIFKETKKWNYSENVVGVYDRSNEAGITRVSQSTYKRQAHTFKTFLIKHNDPEIQKWSRTRLLDAYYCLGKAAKSIGLRPLELIKLVFAIFTDRKLTPRKAIESAYLLIKIL